MKLHLFVPGLAMLAVLPGSISAETQGLSGQFANYEQGKPLSDLIETRQALFLGTADETVRAERERSLLAFVASGAHPQAKAIAIEWLGILGSSNSISALVKAREIPALAAPVAAALERIPGPEAASARGAQAEKRLVTSASAAEVAAFTAALGTGNDDDLIASALNSPNDLLAGAALRRIRAGAGSPGLCGILIENIGKLPAPRQTMLCEALATRPEAAQRLHDILTKRAASGDPAAVTTLGRVLKPDDLPMVLAMVADTGTPGLAEAAEASLLRGTHPDLNPALIRIANAGGAQAAAAIGALAARHATEAVKGLQSLSRSSHPEITAAAYKALGVVMRPEQMGEILEQLVAAEGKPPAAPLGKLVWDLTRRHPEPEAAAGLLEKSAAGAAPETKKLLLQYATRIRPKPAPAQAALDLPKQDDRAKLMPDGHEEIAYLDCGSFAESRGGKAVIRRVEGAGYRFGGVAHPLATVDFGTAVRYEITGLDPAGEYVLGFSAWDADMNGRRQSLEVNGNQYLTGFAPLAWHAGKPTCTRIHLPLPRGSIKDGVLDVAMTAVAGPNAVISELWLLRRKQAAAKRVLIVTGDDYPAHLWRETGPEFAGMLRVDPRLEVTLSESPALLGSPLLASYDAVFLHFKNYADRLPTAEPLWKNLEAYVNGGGGLVIAHFGCGALQEWNGFVNVAGRVWDPEMRGHDPYGEFMVRIRQTGHPATLGIKDFTTTDELYTCLTGETKIEVLAEATSKVDQSVQPMAFVLTPGKGRVFHSPLGHDLGALKARGVRDLYLKGTQWAAGF
jgi:type 1 glutamine amidotransferase